MGGGTVLTDKVATCAFGMAKGDVSVFFVARNLGGSEKQRKVQKAVDDHAVVIFLGRGVVWIGIPRLDVVSFGMEAGGENLCSFYHQVCRGFVALDLIGGVCGGRDQHADIVTKGSLFSSKDLGDLGGDHVGVLIKGFVA